jgi:membrane-bound lytic murein transglycosylase D
MGITKNYLWSALFAALLACVGCHSSQKSATPALPAQANAPTLTATANPKPQTATKPQGAIKAQPATKPKPATEDKKVSAPPKVQPVQPAPKPDPVGELITQVEREYQAGQDNYKAGHLDAAKQSFDRAFNLITGSPPEIRSDERVQGELDRVLDGVNGLQLEDAQASPEPKSEPAPIDEANDVTFPVDPNIKAQAEAEIKATHSDLPLMLTDPVVGYINYFSSRGRATLENSLIRGGRYREVIEKILRDEGVPPELIYLAQAESGFHPLALSRVGARGMWQFMASRAKGYGLQRNQWVDERQDPEKATRAAARHLKDLYNQFGDWYLAMAAYNSGPGTVQSAVRRTGYADFWELYRRNVLPRETRNYVPIIVAVTIMTKNPSQYGLDKVITDKPVPYDKIKIDYSVDLRLVAGCVDASPETLQDLNPSLLRLTTPKDREFELRLPTGTKDKYISAIAAVPRDMRVWWRYHNVGPDDSLESISRVYRTPAKAIAQANTLDGEEKLKSASKIIIPIAPGKHATTEDGATYARHSTRYKLRRGDTLQSVADNFAVPPTMVRRWNHLKGNSLLGRRIVYIHLPVTPSINQPRQTSTPKPKEKNSLRTASDSSLSRHKVKRGETLTSIASTHHTTVAALKRDNGDVATLRPGMILLIKDVR